MKSAPWKAVAAALAAICIAVVPSEVRAQELNEIATLGGSISAAAGINSRGQVIGSSQVASGDSHAFLFSDGVAVDLGTLGGTWSYATAINDAGQVVGNSALPGDTATHAFLYSDGVMIDLGTLGGTQSEAADINEAGQVTGIASPASGYARPFRWTNGTMEDLGTLAGGFESEAVGINDSGEVAGTTSGRAFLFTGGAMVDLGPGTAVGLNNAGQVALNSGLQGYLYSDGVTTSLGTIDGHPLWARDINESGQIAGDMSGAPGRHFLYGDGSAIDIGQVYGGSSNVRALNDFGQILILIDDGEDYSIALYSDGRFAADILGPYDDTVWAVSLNNAGQVAGQRRQYFPPYYGPYVAFVTLCPPMPALGCARAQQSSIRVKAEPDPADDSLKWTWKGADPITQADLGTPAISTSYHACLYESPNSRGRSAARLGLAPSAAWDDRFPRGWTYSDRLASVSGVKKLIVKTGGSGKSRVKLIADGEAIPMPSPYPFSELLTGEVAMSLHNDATGVCMTASFAAPSTSEVDRYSAKTP